MAHSSLCCNAAREKSKAKTNIKRQQKNSNGGYRRTEEKVEKNGSIVEKQNCTSSIIQDF